MDTFHRFGQFIDGHDCSHFVSDRSCGDARHYSTCFNVGCNAGEGYCNYTIADDDVVFNTAVACQDYAIAQFGTACDADLPDQDTSLAYLDIVANLDEVVHNRTAADQGHAEFGPVNAGAGPDLDVVFDNHAADMGNLIMLIVFEVVTKAVKANYAIGANYDAAADYAFGFNYDTLMQDRLIADLDISAHRYVIAQGCSFSDDRTGADDDKRPDGSIWSDLGTFIYFSSGVDPGRGQILRLPKCPKKLCHSLFHMLTSN